MGVKAFGILAMLLLVSASFAADWSYWNEYTGNDLWTKLNVSVGSSVPNLYVYGGGSTNRSNGTATFLYFDDFEDASLSQWNLVGPGSATVASGCVYVNGGGGRHHALEQAVVRECQRHRHVCERLRACQPAGNWIHL